MLNKKSFHKLKFLLTNLVVFLTIFAINPSLASAACVIGTDLGQCGALIEAESVLWSDSKDCGVASNGGSTDTAEYISKTAIMGAILDKKDAATQDEVDYYLELSDETCAIAKNYYQGTIDSRAASDRTKLSKVMCAALDIVTSGAGKTFAAFAIISVGVGFFTGKVSWGLMIGVAAGIAAMFGAPSIVAAISGQDVKTKCNLMNSKF